MRKNILVMMKLLIFSKFWSIWFKIRKHILYSSRFCIWELKIRRRRWGFSETIYAYYDLVKHPSGTHSSLFRASVRPWELLTLTPINKLLCPISNRLLPLSYQCYHMISYAAYGEISPETVSFGPWWAHIVFCFTLFTCQNFVLRSWFVLNRLFLFVLFLINFWW